jgi:hypothetical protein
MVESPNKIDVSPTPRQVGSEWALDAVFPNGKPEAIKGFRTESEAKEWPGSIRHVIWLRDNRVGLGARTVLAAFKCSNASALSLTSRASKLPKRMSDTWITAKLIGLTFCRRVVHRRGLVGVGALLIFTAVLVSLALTKQPAGSDSILGPQMGTGAPVEHFQSAEATDVPDPIALLIDRLSSSDVTVERPISSPVGQNDMEGEIQVIPPRHDVRAPASFTIVGVWAPEPGSCSARNLRDGVLPAVISTHGARAGETSCVFKSQRQAERDWRVVANCRNPHENWTTNVRLTVRGDRLVWTSNRGTQAYTRCRPNA